MFAGFERRDGLPTMQRDRRVDMYEINVVIGEYRVETLISILDTECITDGIETWPRSLSDRIDLGVWVAPVDRDEFGSKSEPDDSDVQVTHSMKTSDAVSPTDHLQ